MRTDNTCGTCVDKEGKIDSLCHIRHECLDNAAIVETKLLEK